MFAHKKTDIDRIAILYTESFKARFKVLLLVVNVHDWSMNVSIIHTYFQWLLCAGQSSNIKVLFKIYINKM